EAQGNARFPASRRAIGADPCRGIGSPGARAAEETRAEPEPGDAEIAGTGSTGQRVVACREPQPEVRVHLAFERGAEVEARSVAPPRRIEQPGSARADSEPEFGGGRSRRRVFPLVAEVRR